MNRFPPVSTFNRWRRRRWSFLITLLVVCVLSGVTSYATSPGTNNCDTGLPPSLIFISDTQAPMLIETLRLQTDDNEEATRTLFRSIAADSTCKAVFHLGDIVSMGWSADSWADFDEKSAPLLQTHIPLYPTLGNHEYMLWGTAGHALFADRYPEYAAGWYAKPYCGIGVVILNSNFSHLSVTERETQQRWYEEQLLHFEADTSIATVLVACHHSPFTNSTVVEPSEGVRQHFVPPFLRCRKASLFLSGHSHAAEHFLRDGKDFVVLGGGGGLLHPLWTGEDQRWKDLFSREGNRSFFHYLRVSRHADSLLVQVVALRNEATSPGVAYSFEITIR